MVKQRLIGQIILHFSTFTTRKIKLLRSVGICRKLNPVCMPVICSLFWNLFLLPHSKSVFTPLCCEISGQLPN